MCLHTLKSITTTEARPVRGLHVENVFILNCPPRILLCRKLPTIGVVWPFKSSKHICRLHLLAAFGGVFDLGQASFRHCDVIVLQMFTPNDANCELRHCYKLF